jgi:hypothetical protein
MQLLVIALMVLLVGCAPTMPKLPVTATPEDRQRGDTCHAATMKRLEDDPVSILTWQRPVQWGDYVQYIPTPERVAGAGLLLVTAPVWYPIMKSRESQRRYDPAFERCLRHGPDYLGWIREPTRFTMPEPDEHWAVRR